MWECVLTKCADFGSNEIKMENHVKHKGFYKSLDLVLEKFEMSNRPIKMSSYRAKPYFCAIHNETPNDLHMQDMNLQTQEKEHEKLAERNVNSLSRYIMYYNITQTHIFLRCQ